MKNIFLSICMLISFSVLTFAQVESVEKEFNREEAIQHFEYLASDELKGRDPLRPEIEMAASYIASEFEKYGAKQIPGASGYYQTIPFIMSSPPKTGEIVIDGETYSQGESLLVLNGNDLEGTFELVDVGFGEEADYEGKDVKGKVVVANVGAPDQMSPGALFSLGAQKVKLAQEHGAIGLIEMFNLPSVPWQLVSRYLNRTQLTVSQGEASELPYIWIKDPKNKVKSDMAKGKVAEAKFRIEKKVNKPIEGKNVVAWIEGTDPELKDQYVMLSAHYDHVGVGEPDANGDSIYNGARDNAVGTVAVINAAKYFAENPPKRSVLLAAWTAEEKGLLGSAYFASNPLIPLDKIIFNLNIDNGGYNDTSIITVIGLGRTSGDSLISEAVTEIGLKTIADPSPEQGLYDRSDNVNFAKKGIPAPTFSLGFTAFDDEINKYYHKQADGIESFDLDYAVKYWKAYILAAQKISNMPTKPFWVPGDKYEEVGKMLYGDN
ncbi:M28 family peptidase [Algoriphagus machipongonensis]|uniref:Peptidase, M28 (Aminopeptidase S) family n=1 Tax=Algoriphagus machipongonensis TaxID=388413 RepID=A3HSB4_9BACT|nr:M28 family peptidase [Algoriphagus machipongonensis]EAZ82732.2 putative peptidase, M28 (aminopeptidase S) family [Algoriphagus machipongonensis]